jgi:predicted alpha-1,6-mannanase (GH76 family)
MNVEWRRADSLNANAWNPNYVLTPELKLLERSLLVTGWVQPILITPAGTIIDGFHRVMLSKDSAALREKFGGMVACCVLQISEADAKMLTVRMNRAKGTHSAIRMADLVKSLILDDGCDPAEVAIELGATKDEIALLLQESVFTQRDIKNYKYSKAWIPRETNPPKRKSA